MNDRKWLKDQIDAQGYAVYDSPKLDDRIVVVEDDFAKVPLKYQHHIRYTVVELELLGELGTGYRLTAKRLRAIHVVKEYLGGVVVS